MSTGPYQYCPTCKTETGHNWIKDLVLGCIKCKRETKVTAAQVFVRPEKYAHLQKEEYEELMAKIEEQPEAKLEIPEEKAEEKPVLAQVVYEPELPVQGLFQKATPIEDNPLHPDRITEKVADILYGTPGIPAPEGLKEMFEDPKNYEQKFIPNDHGHYIIDRKNGEPNIEHPPKNLTSTKIILVDFSKDGDDFFINPEDNPKLPVKKGWADEL